MATERNSSPRPATVALSAQTPTWCCQQGLAGFRTAMWSPYQNGTTPANSRSGGSTALQPPRVALPTGTINPSAAEVVPDAVWRRRDDIGKRETPHKTWLDFTRIHRMVPKKRCRIDAHVAPSLDVRTPMTRRSWPPMSSANILPGAATDCSTTCQSIHPTPGWCSRPAVQGTCD